MASFLRKTAEILIYLAMLVLVIIHFSGKGVFIYEGF
ncbi:Uncharacterised protein [Chlamydia abortus]|nr:Uncharacterised protein [Chlamydia abortus]